MDVLVSVKELARRVRTGEVDDPYERLEAKLTASYQRLPWQLAFDLLDMPDLGDQQPSVLMDTMLMDSLPSKSPLHGAISASSAARPVGCAGFAGAGRYGRRRQPYL
jgi:hypothetical protein